ncbi:hypothetical protein STRAU_5506 [Streptomyces aurantiacus JA 4570]|uniref:Uncharacterized protein n=1 Tax=Streptomyces aurantiacus JA 4570 TaxID=1286094 RepID=S3ZCL4_9ACTN|nr:hypothetical protein STRAU_5506 [Streptomyces aurantiacus JA 4570]
MAEAAQPVLPRRRLLLLGWPALAGLRGRRGTGHRAIVGNLTVTVPRPAPARMDP